MLHPDFRSSPRGLGIREVINYTFSVENPTDEPIVTASESRNSVLASYYTKERELYDSCTNQVEDFAKASKFWSKIANPDGTINSAYGYLIWKKRSLGGPFNSELITPWEWALRSLVNDHDTRQAVLRFSLPEHQWAGNKDQVCTMHGQFFIREKKLLFTVVMRSCDLVKGLVYDLPWFCRIQIRMLNQLQEAGIDVELGPFSYIGHSLHIYDRDVPVVREMIAPTLHSPPQV